MYEIKFSSSKVKKNFKKLLRKVSSKRVKDTMRDILENNPYPSPTHGNSLCKVEQKGDAFGYEITGGDRVLFLVYEQPKKYVEIIFAGSHDEEIRFLRKYSK